MTGCVIVFCTAPAGKKSLAIADAMVSSKLAACANIVPSISSVYRWKGKVERAKESLIIFKTTKRLYSRLEKALKDAHPYDTPEIISADISAGLHDYLKWIRDSASN